MTSPLHAVTEGLDPDELLVVVGPTASGKTSLAIDLAQRLGGEIVGADSVQIYRHFDLGTGKPSDDERSQAPHHLIDHVPPLDPYDAARFVEEADQLVTTLQSRQKQVIVCGGTFLWVKALLHGLAPMPPADPPTRQRHDALVTTQGREALHQALAAVDPAAAQRLNPNDVVRVSRALEVYELTGKTQTAWHEAHAFSENRYRYRLVGVDHPREDLDERIRTRTAQWLAEGWVMQVETLLADGWREARAMSAVGFKQVVQHLDGALPGEELQDAIVRATRTYVRRQRTWLRDQPVQWLDASTL